MTEKQKKFALAYMVYLNATRAAIEAGYSKSTAASIGSENLRKPEIKSYIEESLKRDGLMFEVVKNKLITELVQIGFFSNANDDSRAKMKALEILCKIYGMYERESNIKTVQTSENHKMEMRNRLTKYLNKYLDKRLRCDSP